MFRVRGEQLEALAGRTRAAFVAKVARFVREYFEPHVAAMSAEDLDAWVSAALEVCEWYSVDTEPEVAQVILLLIPLGVDAHDTTPWVDEALGRPAMMPEGRVRLLIQSTMKERGTELDRYIVIEPYASELQRERGKTS